MSCSNFNPDVPSTSISNTPDQDTNRGSGENEEGRKSVTVLISDTGEITYDEETLQSIIDSDQELTTVTFLRVEGTKQAKPVDAMEHNMGTGVTANFQGMSSNISEDSMEAATAILDAASISSAADQGSTAGNETPSLSASNPIAMLNQEEISRLEKVLQSDEAKTFLGDVLAPGNANNISNSGLVNQGSQLNEHEGNENLNESVISESDIVASRNLSTASNTMEENVTHNEEMLTSSGESDIDRKKTQNGRCNLPKGSRRSQRQLDREMKEEAEKIRKENQVFLQKEREQMKSSSSTASSAAEETTDETEAAGNYLTREPERNSLIASHIKIPQDSKTVAELDVIGRPKRERKIPVHMQGGDFVYGSAGAQDAQQPKSVDKSGKKGSFQLSKILPSPSKKIICQLSDDRLEVSELLPTEEKIQTEKVDKKDHTDDAEEKKESDDETSDGDWNSEDDPERLWCICQQPHNNRFMICCDSCLDWYHGKCVGITKKMGKEMEDAGNEWRCPTCKKKEKADAANEKPNNDLEQKLEAKLQKENEKQLQKEKRLSHKSTGPKKKLTGTGPRKRPGSAMSNDGKEEKKLKERTCFVCDKPPRTESIFCSDECIGKHVESAKEFLMKTKPKPILTSKRPELPSMFPGSDKGIKTQRVMVMEPKTNTLISASAPNAPTEETLSVWLKDHPTFHVVMPKVVPTSKFYGVEKSTQKKIIKPTMSLERQKQRLKEKANVDKRLKEYQRQPVSSISVANKSSMHSFAITLEGKPTPTSFAILKSPKVDDPKTKAFQSTDGSHNLKRSHSNNTLASPEERSLQKSISGTSIASSTDKRRRRPSDVDQPSKKRRDSEKGNIYKSISRQYDNNEIDFDPTPLRKNVTKGLKDALKTRVEKTEGITISDADLDKLVKDMEDALYKFYNKDVGSKYKSKYRSLVFNIKDPKNNGLFRKIVRKEYSPNRIASMTAEEMANKELKEWRQAELKHDIEKIKSHEIEMAQIGTKLVMKTHKGDMVMEDGRESSMVELINEEVKLPDEVKLEDINASTRNFGIKTWEHGIHGFESQCDVCTAKISLDEFLKAKIERERREAAKNHNSSAHKSTSKSNSTSSHRRHRRDHKDKRRHIRESSDHRRHSSGSQRKSSSSVSHEKKEKPLDKSMHKSNEKGKDGHDKSDLTIELSLKVDKKEKFINELHSTHEEHNNENINESDKGTHVKGSSHKTSHLHHSKSSSSSYRKSKSTTTRVKENNPSSESYKETNVPVRSNRPTDCGKDNRRTSSYDKEVSPTTKVKDVSMSGSASTEKTSGHKISTDTSKLKGTVEDDDELTRKEVTAEDVAKAESLIKKITASSSSIGNFSQYERDESEAVPSSSDIEQTEPNVNDSYSEMVSSTVTIKTPDTSGLNVSSDSNPIVWKGNIHMPDVATFSVIAKQVSGTTDYLTVDLKEALKIVGRIAPQTVWDYVSQVSESPSKEILLVKLEPTTDDENINYTSFFNYLQQRNRLGVVGNNSKMVKDCYILPLGAADTINDALLPLDGPGLEDARPNMLIALIVRTRRKRPGDAERDAERHRLQLIKKSKNEMENKATEIITINDEPDIMDKGTSKRSSAKSSYVEGADQVSDDEMQYDPATAGCWPLNDSPSLEKGASLDGTQAAKHDSEEIYDPESAKFSPEDDSSSQPATDRNLSITAKMVQLNREIEMQKAENAILKSKVNEPPIPSNSSPKGGEKEKNKTGSIAGFQGLPTGIASILFGEGSGTNTNEIPGLGDITEDGGGIHSMIKDPRKNLTKSSPPENTPNPTTLSRLSDSELLAKAAAQMPRENRPLQNYELSQHINPSDTKQQSQFTLPQRATSSIDSASSMQGQVWKQRQFEMPYGTSEVHDVHNKHPSPWMHGNAPRGRVQEEYREASTRYGKYDIPNKGQPDWDRTHRHDFGTEDSQRNWENEYHYSNVGNRKPWPNHPRDSWKYSTQADVRNRKDSNSWRDRDMRREHSREGAGINEHRERDRDYRSSRGGNQSRYRSHSRSESKDDDPRPPGEDDIINDRPCNRSALSPGRSRSPSGRKDTSNRVEASTSLQSIDERIANVVERLPN